MGKVELGSRVLLYPMPVTLVGVNVRGKPNYLTIAHVGIMNHSTISISSARIHYSNPGFRENGTFSVNIPTTKMVEVTDYCGIYSARKIDKARLFDTFYGKLGTAPMIQECPVNIECKIIHTLELSRHEVFIGEIFETYCNEQYLTEGVPDLTKIDPILFALTDARSYKPEGDKSIFLGGQYWKLGERFARAWNIGKDYRPKKIKFEGTRNPSLNCKE